MECKRPMSNITGPRHPVDTTYRVVEREEVLASAFEDFVQKIVAAGWDEPEVALTLADIADDYVITLAARLP